MINKKTIILLFAIQTFCMQAASSGLTDLKLQKYLSKFVFVPDFKPMKRQQQEIIIINDKFRLQDNWFDRGFLKVSHYHNHSLCCTHTQLVTNQEGKTRFRIRFKDRATGQISTATVIDPSKNQTCLTLHEIAFIYMRHNGYKCLFKDLI